MGCNREDLKVVIETMLLFSITSVQCDFGHAAHAKQARLNSRADHRLDPTANFMFLRLSFGGDSPRNGRDVMTTGLLTLLSMRNDWAVGTSFLHHGLKGAYGAR
jgi:hypothetical protein